MMQIHILRMINLENYHVYIGKKEILKDINLNIKTPFTLLLSGKNGTGKTVFMNSLLGFHKTKGKKIFPYKKIIYIPDTPFFTEQFTVKEVLKTYRYFYNISIKQMINILNSLNFTYPLSYKISELSLGSRKKLEIIPLFIDKYQLYLLDETTNHLDKETINIISDRINNLTDTIIIDHNQDFINTLKNKNKNIKEAVCREKSIILSS